jgi:hypothetical protein
MRVPSRLFELRNFGSRWRTAFSASRRRAILRLFYVNAGDTAEYLPSMHGSGDNEVILYPNRMISIVMAKASVEVLGPEKTRSDEGPVTIRAVERLAPF